MVKNNILVFVFAFTFFVSADQKSEIEKSYQNILHIKEDLSVNKKANIYKVIASSDDLSLSSVTIDIPKEDNIKLYRTPSKRDKYIIKILDENNINYNKPSRVSKENSQFKEAKKLNAEYLINADEDTIKNLITNETKAFDIEVILEH